MKISAPTLSDVTLLEDRAASCFGIAGQGFLIGSRAGAAGSLVLTEEALVFSYGEEGSVIDIPVHEIHRLGMGRWHEGTGSFVPVLKITYRSNLILAVQVAHPEKWVEAIENLAMRKHLPPLGKDRPRTITTLRTSRMVIGGILIVALLSTVLPAFFTWMHRSTLRERNAPSESAPSTARESAG